MVKSSFLFWYILLLFFWIFVVFNKICSPFFGLTKSTFLRMSWIAFDKKAYFIIKFNFSLEFFSLFCFLSFCFLSFCSFFLSIFFTGFISFFDILVISNFIEVKESFIILFFELIFIGNFINASFWFFWWFFCKLLWDGSLFLSDFSFFNKSLFMWFSYEFVILVFSSLLLYILLFLLFVNLFSEKKLLFTIFENIFEFINDFPNKKWDEYELLSLKLLLFVVEGEFIDL